MGWMYRWGRALGRIAEMREHHLLCSTANGLHRLAYVEWGDPDNPRVLVCVHGLTRNGRDFDELARALSRDYRVVCPDVAGRGRSDWLHSASEYGFGTYVADMVTLIGRLNVDSVDWVGTSMGGLIGMMLARLPGAPIGKLVLNDVGPLVSADSLRRIGEYLGKAPRFADLAAAEAYIRQVSAPFGPLSDAQWRHLTETSVRPAPDGGWEMRYDPAIAEPYRQAFLYVDVDLWPIYEAVRCPTLVLRGAESDLLTRHTAEEMTRRGPKATLREIPGVGHAPMFSDAFQIGLVKTFLK